MSVGQELLDVPLPKMVRDLALGIADAQGALDANSLETTLALANEKIDFIPNIIATVPADGGAATVTNIEAKDIPLIAFIKPTWYQFSETKIEVGMDIKTTMQKETKLAIGVKAKGGWGPVSVSVSVDVQHNRKFGKEVHGTSKLSVTMVPVPPPPLLTPNVEIKYLEPAQA